MISSETWTWIHSPSFRATPLDMKGEAHEHFLLGINQLIGHGWPYSPPAAGRPGWMLYAAGALGDANPWWPVIPELARYLQRLSFLLRQGEPVADIALYAPTEDAYASFRRGKETFLNLWKTSRDLIGSEVIAAILGAGYNYDLIDEGLLVEAAARRYKAVILPGLHYLPETAKSWLAEFMADGGLVLALGAEPLGGLPGSKVVSLEKLARSLHAAVPPDVTITPPSPSVGAVHRALPDADIYFVANTGNAPLSISARFRTARERAELWDAATGRIAPAVSRDGEIALDLAPYAACVVLFRAGAAAAAQPPREAPTKREPLASGWQVELAPTGSARPVDLPHDWSSEPAARHFSGRASYTRDIRIGAGCCGARIWLDFGDAQPATREALAAGTICGRSYAALLHPPIREAATIWVNGELAGHLWAPPYQIELTELLREATNEFRVDVYNTAMNMLAEDGRLPDMTALVERYGQRARLQDLDDPQPLPSGILAVPHLVIES